jgi:hypothetical protein
MVSFIDKIRRPKKEDRYDPDAVVFTQQLIASQEPPDAASQAAKDAEGINIHAIEDTPLLRIAEELSIIPAQPDRIIKMSDGNGGIIEVPISGKNAEPVPWAMGLRAAKSPVTSTRFVTKKIALRKENRMRRNFLVMKINMSQSSRRYFSDFLNFEEDNAVDGIFDSVDGQKMLALKTTGKNMRVKVNNNESFNGEK